MRPRLRKLVNLFGIDDGPSRPPEPDDQPLSVKRVDEQRSAEEAKRRLEQTRERLKQQIPPPAV